MQDPWNNVYGKWQLENMDESHFYQASYQQENRKPGLLRRIEHYFSRELIILRCQLATLRWSPTYMVEQQCECVES